MEKENEMKVTFSMIWLTAAFGLIIATMLNCSVADRAVELSISGIQYYCKADETTRAALRAKYTTSKGLLAQVNCDNLED